MTRRFFGTDGIRGLAGEEPLDERTIERLGYAASFVLNSSKHEENQKKVIIGRDTRESGVWIFEALCRGFNKGGFQVVYAGIVPTPLVSMLAREDDYICGAVISASHNPYQDNGIKFFAHSGEKLSDDIELKIEEEIAKISGDVEFGEAEYTDISRFAYDYYSKFLKTTLPADYNLKGLKIVVDCANGALYEIGPKFLKSLGADVIPLSINPNGRNINDNCGSTYLLNMINKVKENGADLGLAFDGDGDRVLFTDEHGRNLDGDHILAMMAKFLKDKGLLKNNTLIVTVMANLALKLAMKELDINVVDTNVGDRYVYEKMIELDASIGGEQSGHIIFRDFATTGDGLLTAVQVLNVIKETKKSFSFLADIITKLPQILVNVTVKDKKDVSQIEELENMHTNMIEQLGERGRVLIRYSGTEPLLRIMIEGPDYNVIENMANNYAGLVKDILG